MLLGYAEAVYELAKFMEREGVQSHHVGAIMTSAGTLHPDMRRVIERAFRAPVFNRYGSRELGGTACECEMHEGLHISPLTHYVEIISPEGGPCAPGELGELVLTSLTNHAMPLIRYRIGDMASWATGTCSCGRRWPLLSGVTGRVTETFVRRDGSVVVPEYLIHLVGVILYRPHYRRFQIVQEDYERVRIRIVMGDPRPRNDVVNGELDEIGAKVRLVMGKNCAVDFSLEVDIEPTASGKYLYTLSRVPR
jgi:phenylacetate-CoA ligase